MVSSDEAQMQLANLRALASSSPMTAFELTKSLLALCDVSMHASENCELLQIQSLALRKLGRLHDALLAADQAVRVAEIAGNARLLGSALQSLAWVWFDLNAGESALQCIERALSAVEDSCGAQELLQLRYITACTFRKLGRLDEAMEMLIDIWPQTDDSLRFRCSGALVSTLLYRNCPQEAAVWLMKAKACAKSCSDSAWLASLTARVNRALHDIDAIKAVLVDYQDTLVNFPMDEASVYLNLMAIYLEKGLLEDAKNICYRIDAQNALSDEECIDYFCLRAELAKALQLHSESELFYQNARSLEERRQRLQNEYRIKAACLTLSHLDMRIKLAGSQFEVDVLRKAVLAQEKALQRLNSSAPLNESLLGELQAIQQKAGDDKSTIDDLATLGFYLVYQIFVNLKTGQPAGYEALLRLNHPMLGPMIPNDFISRLERSGEIVTVGRWVFAQACKDLALLSATHQIPLCMAVNVALPQLMDVEFADYVSRQLIMAGVSATCLELEITESMAIDDHAQVMSVLDALKGLGLKLSIDDFGTGFCNFARLIDIEPHKIKIDRSLVSKIEAGSREQRLVKSLIQSGQSQEMTVTAEGIENPQQLMFLKSIGCDFGQGYYFRRPLPIDDALEISPSSYESGGYIASST